jgi:ribosome modulation factor/uncharacterized protein (UPF0335 family)
MPNRTETADRTQLEPEIFLKRFRSIADKATDAEDAKAAWKSEVEAGKASGVDIKALKLVYKLRKMDTRDAQAMLRHTILYLRWLGLNLLDQEELFDSAGPSTTGLTEQVIATHAAWEAGNQGYQAGKAGHPLDSNPYAPGTETYQRWGAEWYDGADDKKSGPPGTKDIKPKDDGPHPEDGGEEGP